MTTPMPYHQAADEVRKLLRGLKAIDIVSAAMERAGSLEQAVSEAEARLATLREEEATALAQLQAAKIDIDVAKGEAKDILADAKDKAKAIAAKAEAKALETIAAAEAKAGDIAAKWDVAAQEEAALRIDAENHRTELAELQKRIDAARAKIASLLGA